MARTFSVRRSTAPASAGRYRREHSLDPLLGNHHRHAAQSGADHDGALHQSQDQWNGGPEQRHQRDRNQSGRDRRGANHCLRHDRCTDCIHHVQHTIGTPLPRHVALLPAPVERRGPVGYVSFADSTSATPPTAPLAGAFSPDNSIFFVSTAGDNQIHFISIPTNVSTSAPPTETKHISPESACMHASFRRRQRCRLPLPNCARPQYSVPATASPSSRAR